MSGLGRKIGWPLTVLVAVVTAALCYTAVWFPEKIDGDKVGTTFILNLVVGFGLWSWGLFDD